MSEFSSDICYLILSVKFYTVMTKTTELAKEYAQANYDEWVGDNYWQVENDYEDIKDAYLNGSADMLERVLDFMRTFQNSSGEFPLYDYIGNVRKAMEE